jgi:ABC-2 type transport system ATP-binding protein
MIIAQQLRKRYNGVDALNLPSITIQEGETFGLVGNNGAGKTTFFSLILDLIMPTEGMVLSRGTNVMRSEHWKEYTGAYLDERFLIDFLTPEEYFEFIGGVYRLPAARIENQLKSMEDFFHGEILGTGKYIRELSRGNQKKVGIAAALLHKPDLLVLDEPFPHLDPSSVIRLKNLLRQSHREHGTTLLISSHDLNHVTEVCDRIVLLEKGKAIRDLRTGEETLKILQKYFGS